ncbi:demethoxyubiquinone hydroxylase family protein [Dankookia rubra]|uniref:Demethoxyubiquinone hydroxylase family protein n=1 Tax=Dankookia rubra TaxID=1442381 RepID=A0A4R5Q831_9PROT|nr:demethoxyubiquinone hydroxylase family protein [Dankookia rubra]TDH58753.1 demethoxyubiquinone hydroxylase family protein [Dankookia rubra]
MTASAGPGIGIAPLLARIPGLLGDLRSDHAGKTGAVMIQRGILARATDPAIRAFATGPLATEAEHLRLLEAMLAPGQRSILLPIRRVAGFLPALFGPRANYATIEAVETFVDHHHAERIAKLDHAGAEGALRRLLETCRGEAAAALGGAARGPLLRAWAFVVGSGSAPAVSAARRV